MNSGSSLARRIARAVFVSMGVIALLLSFVVPIVDEGMRQDLLRHLTVPLSVAAAFLLSAFFVTRATIWGLGLLTMLDALLVTFLWHRAVGKDFVLLRPLCLSLACLLFEDIRILVVSKRRIA